MESKTAKVRRRKIGRAFAVAASAWLFWTIGRATILLRNGQQIAQRNASFSRDYFVGKATSPIVSYLVMGDSTAAGWGAQNVRETFAYRVAQAVANRGFRVHVVNVAVGGARLEDVLQHQIASLDIHPQLVSITVGANDATHGTSEIEYSNQLQTLFSALKKSSAKTVLVANTPDLSRIPALPGLLAQVSDNRARHQNVLFDKALREANIREANRRGTTIRAVDLYRDGKLVHRRDNDQYAEDLFHPSGSGYNVWAKLFIAQLT